MGWRGATGTPEQPGSAGTLLFLRMLRIVCVCVCVCVCVVYPPTYHFIAIISNGN